MNYEQIGKQIGMLVQKKNESYGSAFAKSDDFLRILYPDGVAPEQYNDMLAIVRIFDKLMRVSNGNQGDENAYMDIAGYSILKAGENV